MNRQNGNLASNVGSFVKSGRIAVALPPGILKQVKELAETLGSSESKAVLLLVIEGLKVVQGTENPLRKSQK